MTSTGSRISLWLPLSTAEEWANLATQTNLESESEIFCWLKQRRRKPTTNFSCVYRFSSNNDICFRELRHFMKIFTVLALAIAVFAVIFASQNSETVAIHLLNLSYQTSMGLIALVIFSAGVLMGLFISVPPMIGRMSKISSLKRRVEEQNREIESFNKILETSRRNDFPQQI